MHCCLVKGNISQFLSLAFSSSFFSFFFLATLIKRYSEPKKQKKLTSSTQWDVLHQSTNNSVQESQWLKIYQISLAHLLPKLIIIKNKNKIHFLVFSSFLPYFKPQLFSSPQTKEKKKEENCNQTLH